MYIIYRIIEIITNPVAMKKFFLFNRGKVLISIFLFTFFSNCSFQNSDIIAVKKSITDLGGMYSKTVEEVVQDVVGVHGSANWSAFKPAENFSEEVRVVEVNITKPDTFVYSTLRIQFMYNRSTGYVKQGAIIINDNNCSLMQWWAVYANILLLNSGAFSKDVSSGQNNKSGNSHTQNGITNNEENQNLAEDQKLEVGILDRPDTNAYFQYTSNEWIDLSKGIDDKTAVIHNELSHIMEASSRIIVEFRDKKALEYEILKVTPFREGIQYTVEINGKRKIITKCKEQAGGYCFSIENEWKASKIFEAMPAGID
jgi:hypothetical protein